MNEKVPWLRPLILRCVQRGFIILFYIVLLFGCLNIPRLIEDFTKDRSLNVCAFTETFSPQAIARFEKMTGVKVHVTYVELDEQIYTKFKINNGVGYDVVNVSDFMVQSLKAAGFLHQLDQSKIPSISQLDQQLLHRSYDVNNMYSVPHKWFMYGIAYDKRFFKQSSDDMSLDFIFKNPKDLYKQGLVPSPYKLCMIDSPNDAFFLALLYLFGPNVDPSVQECIKARNLLVEQKKWVECYTLYSIEYFLLTGVIPIALTSSSFARKIMIANNNFDFAIPKEGGILVIENLVIPQKSKKIDLAYQFINFMLSDQIASLNSSAYGWASANKKAQLAFLQDFKCSHLCPSASILDRLYIPLFPDSMRPRIEDAWLDVEFA